MDLTAVRLDDRARNRQAEATAAGVSGSAAVEAVEALEDPLELIGRYSGAGKDSADKSKERADESMDRADRSRDVRDR